MKTFVKGAMLASVAAMGLSLAACDSKTENAAENQADNPWRSQCNTSKFN